MYTSRSETKLIVAIVEKTEEGWELSRVVRGDNHPTGDPRVLNDVGFFEELVFEGGVELIIWGDDPPKTGTIFRISGKCYTETSTSIDFIGPEYDSGFELHTWKEIRMSGALQMIELLYNHMQLIDQSRKMSDFLVAAKSGPHSIIARDLDEAKSLRKQHAFPRSTSWVSINSLKGLRGRSHPVLFTPQAFDKLMEAALDDVCKLQEVKEALA
jgi:hypothetical protein